MDFLFNALLDIDMAREAIIQQIEDSTGQAIDRAKLAELLDSLNGQHGPSPLTNVPAADLLAHVRA